MKVKEIMTKDIISVTPQTPLKELANIIKEKRIHGVPVLNEDGVLVGVVTLTDMLKILQRIAYWSEIEKAKPELGIKEALVKEKEDASVGANMTTLVRTVKEDDDIEKALTLMCKHNVHTIPVLKDGKLAGIVGASDIVKIFV
ncbi:CBS domain-containing protein [Candidatus Omnitrophota bacterium]